jgi:hypothetical protein
VTSRWRRAVATHGLAGTVALMPRLVRQRMRRLRPAARREARRARELDLRLNIETRREVALGGLRIESPNAPLGVKYQPTPASDFAALMARLPIDHARFTFVDVGAGKGMCLCLAAAWPFRQIVGVEFSPALADVARTNLAGLRLPRQRCDDLRVECVDAISFAFPDRPSVIYFFNPFGGPVMDGVLTNLTASLLAHPRELFVVYYNAAHRALFDRSPHLQLVETLGPPLVGEPSAIYRARPPLERCC